MNALSSKTSAYLDAISSLPPAPTLVTELLSLFREPDKDIDEVIRLISYEPTLTAEILRLCNGAFFASEEPISDMFTAVTRLGFYEVYCRVVALFGTQTRAMDGAGEGVDVEKLWRHSVMAAAATSVVAETINEPKALGFTAGLLHDIGKLALASVERQRYARLIQLVNAEGTRFINAERATFGVDHAELGGELMSRWNLPPEIVAAVRHHHDLAADQPFLRLAAAVQLADAITHRLGGGDLVPGDLDATAAASLGILQLQPGDLDRLTELTSSEVEQLDGLLEM